MPKPVFFTGGERTIADDDTIVSKVDLKGRFTCAYRVFLSITGYTRKEIFCQSAIPRCVLKQVWAIIAAGREISAYVINGVRNGDHYWVYAHVTANFDAAGRIIGYLSNCRIPDRPMLFDVLAQKGVVYDESIATAGQERGHSYH